MVNVDSPCPRAGCSLTDKALLPEPLVSLALRKLSNTGGWELLLDHQYIHFRSLDTFARL